MRPILFFPQEHAKIRRRKNRADILKLYDQFFIFFLPKNLKSGLGRLWIPYMKSSFTDRMPTADSKGSETVNQSCSCGPSDERCPCLGGSLGMMTSDKLYLL